MWFFLMIVREDQIMKEKLLKVRHQVEKGPGKHLKMKFLPEILRSHNTTCCGRELIVK